MRPILPLLSLLILLAPSFAQTITEFTTTINVCGTSTVAWIREGFGGCSGPTLFFSDPSYTRCLSFTYSSTRTTVITQTGGRTLTLSSSCVEPPALCPPGFGYVTAMSSGGGPTVFNPVLCQRIGGVTAAQLSCTRLGGTYDTGVGTCTGFSCPLSTGCQASSANCRLVSTLNAGLAPTPCTAVGSICLNASGNSEYRCGVPCNTRACYDDAGVQVCDAPNNRCGVCASGQRLDALTCFGGISASLAPTRRRERLLMERREKIARDHALCPADLTPCPVGFARDGGYECLDVHTELESCGGCRSTGLGIDCSALPGVRLGGTTCAEGRCVVSACRRGFRLEKGRCV
ncbi:hypothetical protein BDY24DRAFT_417604 [Mrakia frigida]|uniref:uncharacterized protein n=1 Tax=Mrakia frigida TaxID=29902 RepID=UPI003FCBF7EA